MALTKIDSLPSSSIEPYDIDGKEYYSNDELFDHCKLFFRGCKRACNIIKQKNISIDNYIYIRFNNDDEYIVTNGKSKKHDKLYLAKEYVESNIPELSNNDEVKYEYENAPEILYLEDDEKFHDDEGNMYEIETRGIKKYDKIYFKVGDIEKCFGMNRLRDTITDERKDGYIENKHYVYFIVNDHTLISRQCNRPNIKLFLTFAGFKRFIEISHLLSIASKHVLYRWLKLFDTDNIKRDFIINKQLDRMQYNLGYVYCITSELINHVKIGFWKGNIEGLRSRYVTYYGSNLEIYYIKSNNARELEQKCFKQFKNYNVTNELFSKEYLNEYKEYLKNNEDDEIYSEELVDITESNEDNLNNYLDNVTKISNYEEYYISSWDVDEDSLINNIDIIISNKKYYFSVKSAMIEFELFISERYIMNNKCDFVRTEENVVFLTCTGLLRVLFVSQSTKVDKFVFWASETLFTVQMGTKDQKDELIATIKDIPVKNIKAIFDKSAESLPCIYLFKLGNVSALRESMDIDISIPDNSTVCKFGFTDNIERRMLEHEADFSKINGVKLELMIYSIVDVLYLSDAEGSIKRYFRSMKFKYRKYKELVIINKTMQKDIDREYKEIVELYGGRTKELVHRIENMEHKNEIAMMKNDKKSQDMINSLRLDLSKMEKLYEEKINELNQCLSKMETKYRDEIYKSELNNKIMERDIYYLKLMNKSPGETIDIFDC